MAEESSPLSAVSSKELKKRIEESLVAQMPGRGGWVQLVVGRNELRLLGVYREVKVHYLHVVEEGRSLSRRFHCPGEGCPACLRAERAKEQGRAAQAQSYGAKPRYLWLCMDLRDSENADGSLKVKLFEHGPALPIGVEDGSGGRGSRHLGPQGGPGRHHREAPARPPP